jgi:hypothetical protein
MLSAKAQSPSLAETVDWMKSKTDELGLIYSEARDDENSMPRITTWEAVGSSGCTLTLRNRNERQGPPPKRISSRDIMANRMAASVMFSFSDFNPQNVTENVDTGMLSTLNIRLNTTNKKKAVKWQISGKNYEYNSLIISFKDQAIAQRFTKAIKHAIELCGGKPDKREPF